VSAIPADASSKLNNWTQNAHAGSPYAPASDFRPDALEHIDPGPQAGAAARHFARLDRWAPDTRLSAKSFESWHGLCL